MTRTDPMPADARAPRSVGIVVLATIAVVAALYFGRVLFVPIAMAVLFTALLRPVVRRFERAGLSAPFGATVVLVVLLGVLTVAALSLADPVGDWVAQAPKTLEVAHQRLEKLRRPLQLITTAAQKMESVATDQGAQGAPAPTQRAGPAPPPAVPPPQSNVTALAARVFGTTTAVLGGIVEVVLLMFLLLASGDKFLGKLVKVLPGRDKREAVEIADETERVVSRYMLVTALINAGQGAVVGVAMALIHVPNPVLWGILTFFLEFIPYLGAALMLILLTLVGLASFDRIGQVLLAPLIYLTITTLQNNLVSPLAYGIRLRLNPVAVLVGVLFWYYMWGVPGAFLAVPIIATIKILGDHYKSLSPIAEFLSD